MRPRREPAPDPFGEDPFEALLGQRRGRAREPKLLVEAAVSRTRLHVGEPLLLTYWLYTQISVSDLQFVDAPQYPGFWAEDLEKPPTPPQGEGATVEGETYRRFPIFVKLLFPTRAGRLTIPATNLRLGLPRQSFFDSGGVVAAGDQGGWPSPSIPSRRRRASPGRWDVSAWPRPSTSPPSPSAKRRPFASRSRAPAT